MIFSEDLKGFGSCCCDAMALRGGRRKGRDSLVDRRSCFASVRLDRRFQELKGQTNRFKWSRLDNNNNNNNNDYSEVNRPKKNMKPIGKISIADEDKDESGSIYEMFRDKKTQEPQILHYYIRNQSTGNEIVFNNSNSNMLMNQDVFQVPTRGIIRVPSNKFQSYKKNYLNKSSKSSIMNYCHLNKINIVQVTFLVCLISLSGLVHGSSKQKKYEDDTNIVLPPYEPTRKSNSLNDRSYLDKVSNRAEDVEHHNQHVNYEDDENNNNNNENNDKTHHKKLDRAAQIQLEPAKSEPKASGSATSAKFTRVNELETFLDEMDQNELRQVAAGRPIAGDLFRPKTINQLSSSPASIASSSVGSPTTSNSHGQESTDRSNVARDREVGGNLETSQTTDRSSFPECALILQRTYVKNMGDPKHPMVPFGRTEQACISYNHINKAIEQAKHKLKFRDMTKMRMNLQMANNGKPIAPIDVIHTSLEPPTDLIAAIGEINMATTQILADQFDLSNDELLNGLPLIDMSKTNFWPICPLLVRQNIKCEITRFRTQTGHCNNLKHPTWGAAMTPFARYLPPTHPDGIWIPRKSIITEMSIPAHHRHSPSIMHPLFMAGGIQLQSAINAVNSIQSNNNIDGIPSHNPLDDMSFASSVQFIHHAHPTEASSSHNVERLPVTEAASNRIENLSGENVIDAHYKRMKSQSGLDSPSFSGSKPASEQEAQSIQTTAVETNRLAMSAKELPPVRLISAVVHHDVDIPNHDLSILFMSWGQLLDHDMTRAAQPPSTIKCCGNEQPKNKLCLPIKVPDNDPFYSRFNVKCLEFRRSLAGLRPNCVLGPRVHQNAITSPIDANFVYGSSQAEAGALRLFKGGRLRDRDWFKHQSLKPLLPAQEEEPDQDCLGRPRDLFCFLAGDVRANEQIHLTVLHTLYMREHNRIADKLASLNPHWSDERIYQETRHIVAAGVQHVMLIEYIPLLIGQKMSQLYNLTGHFNGMGHSQNGAYWHGYDPSVTTSVSNSFAAAAFRQGHTFIRNTVERYNKYHELVGSEKLRHLFKQPFLLYQPGALDELTLGLIDQPTQSYDPFISEEVAGHLFQPPESQFGHDLPSINLQRGREQGLPGYNLFREWCGLPRAESFDDLVPYLTNKTAFLYSRLYKHVDDIDLWSGGISERRLPGAAIGPTFACIIARQFSNTRRGDRFWYENPGLPSSFTPEQLAEIRKISLARILCANSDDLPTIQRWALRMAHPVLNPRIPCNQLPELDLRYWQED